jgi:peptidoglycan/xylan/chitin deacetylase (PgdA/CDA1 family)
MLTKLLRKALAFSPALPGYRLLARRARSQSVTIFMYHGVTPAPLPVFNWCQLDAALFEKQVRFLAQEYTVLPLGEVVDRLANGLPLPEYAAAVTFDDGYRNVGTTAYPILQRYQLPSTVFLVTSLVETDQPPWTGRLFHGLATTEAVAIRLGGEEWPLRTRSQQAAAYTAVCERLKTLPQGEKEARLVELLNQLGGQSVPADAPMATMGWEEVERLSRTGLVTFGSHTHTHPILSRCALPMQREELRVSRDILRERLGSADLFAYPNGGRDDFSADTKRLLMELGYRCGLATVHGLNRPGADLYELRRVGVGADSGFAQFQFDTIR